MAEENIMIDIETLGGTPDGVILSIGAVRFDDKSIFDDFYVNVTIQSCLDVGMKIDPKTIEWWFGQSDAARSALFVDTISITDAMNRLREWFKKSADKKIVWANGAAFDLAIVRRAFDLTGVGCPFHWGNEMCMRPIRRIGYMLGRDYSKDKKTGGVTLHNALEDARLQAKYVMEVLALVRFNHE